MFFSSWVSSPCPKWRDPRQPQVASVIVWSAHDYTHRCKVPEQAKLDTGTLRQALLAASSACPSSALRASEILRHCVPQNDVEGMGENGISPYIMREVCHPSNGIVGATGRSPLHNNIGKGIPSLPRFFGIRRAGFHARLVAERKNPLQPTREGFLSTRNSAGYIP